MTQPGTDPDRHYAALLGGGGEIHQGLGMKVACGSGADVMVSRTWGYFVQELKENEVIDPAQSGPFFVDCSKHGQYLAYVQLLPRGPANDAGSIPPTMPILLIPLPKVEYIQPYGMS